MDKLVSIVVPVYNVEKYLDRCISSITGQTYKNLEIILVDDGSKDASGQMCNQWALKDCRIRVIHKANGGLGMARNTGIDYATGSYIFFFDSDDYVAPTIVEKCVLDAVEFGSQVVLYGRNRVYNELHEKPGRIVEKHCIYCDDAVKNSLLPSLFTYELGIGVSAWGKMYDLQMLKQYNLYFPSERQIISEDAYFTLELFTKVTKATILPECLYFYCVRNNSLTRVYREDRQQCIDNFLEQCCSYVRQSNLPDILIKHIQSRYHGLTLANMVQVIKAEMPRKKRSQILKELYGNKTLYETLGEETIRLDGRFPRIFWRCLKLRFDWLCTLLLWLNVCKQKLGEFKV